MTHLCPSLLLHSAQSTHDHPPPANLPFYFLGPSSLYFGDEANSALLQSPLSFLSPPTLLPPCAPFSFIHILLLHQRQSSHRAAALPHYKLSHCFYVHSSGFPSSGDFTFISSSSTTRSSLFCVGAFLSLPVFPPLLLLVCASLPSLSSYPIQSRHFLYLSFSPSCFPLPPPSQSLVTRCDKPLPRYHSNRVPVATGQRRRRRVGWPQLSHAASTL